MTQQQYEEYKAMLLERRLADRIDGVKYVRLAIKLGEWGKRGGITKL